MKTVLLADESATHDFGEKFARDFILNNSKDLEIHLIGDLGAGKTFLSRSIINSCGWNGMVKSPTYTLVETYQNDKADIHHFDCYRLSDPEELEYIGIRDYLKSNTLQLIEWPELGRGSIAKADISIKLSGNRDYREAQISFESILGKSIKKCAIG